MAGTVNEVEGKILGIDPEVEIRKLLSLGFEKSFDGELVAKFFKNDRGDTLRLRREARGWMLNYKGKPTAEETEQVKSRPETEVLVSSADGAQAILEAVGFEKVRTVTKRRRTFLLREDGMTVSHVEIDEYPGIPPLLEIESDSIEKVLSVAESLGFPAERVVSDTVRDLEKRYGIRLGTED